MKIHISEFDIDMDLGNKGFKLAVYDTKNNHLGSVQIGKAKIKWFKGKTAKNHIEVKWEDFISWLETQKS